MPGQSAITILVLVGNILGSQGLTWYNFIADTWLVGIIPVTLYPFFGGKIWCRYWCPLAKMMEILQQSVHAISSQPVCHPLQ